MGVCFSQSVRLYLQLLSNGQFVYDVSHVRALRLGCSAVCRHMEVSWHLRTHTYTQSYFILSQ